MSLFIADGTQQPVSFFATIIQSYIYQKTGNVIVVKHPLQTEREKELFIKAIEIIERLTG